MKTNSMIANFVKAVCAVLFVGYFGSALAASGEMGTGVPEVNLYRGGNVNNPVPEATITLTSRVTIGYPAGCTSLKMTSAIMGVDGFSMAMQTMQAAKIAGKPVRFYAHSQWGSGCEVDYVQMKDAPAPVTSCQMNVTACPNHPTVIGIFDDAYNNSNTIQANCLARASDFASWCATTLPVTASFISDGVVAAFKTVGTN